MIRNKRNVFKERVNDNHDKEDNYRNNDRDNNNDILIWVMIRIIMY